MVSELRFVDLDVVNKKRLKDLLNKKNIRTHLMGHDEFTDSSLQEWIDGKQQVNAQPGCRVQAVLVEGQLAGWCGIQLENGNPEIAIVIDQKFWGLGRRIFEQLMIWAEEFKHEFVFIHFLETRPEYRFLKKISESVYETTLYNHKFMTYKIPVKR
ncbi:hypothetical protein MAH1_21530 [Sessilibacter sp. MAH1]